MNGERCLAPISGGLGEWDATLEWIVTAVEERDPDTVTAISISPHYDRLRSHPTFQALLRRINLEP